MSQEARNTERGFRNFSNLRSQQVAFVSAGSLRPDDVIEKQMSEVSLDGDAKQSQAPVTEAPVTDPSEYAMRSNVRERQEAWDRMTSPKITAADPIPSAEEPNPYFFVDSTGSGPRPVRSLPPPESLAPSEAFSSASDSGDVSEDEVVFAGRGGSRNRPLPWPSPNASHGQNVPSTSTVVSRQPVKVVPLEIIRTAVPTSDSRPTPEGSMQISHPSQLPLTAPISSRNSSQGPCREDGSSFVPLRQRRKKMDRSQSESGDDEYLNDYIANMKNYDSSEEEVSANVPKPAPAPKRGRSLSWSSADLEDLDVLSTSNELPPDVGRVLSKRQREDGRQYLVAAEGETADEARWIRQDLLTMAGAAEAILMFEEPENKIPDDAEGTENSEEDGEDELILDDLADAIESEEDEMAINQLKKTQMSDYQIAKALAKQEELGMPTDDILLFDEATNGRSRPSKLSKANVRVERRSGKKSRRSDGFPSAELFADVVEEDPYGGFDVMDFERPSLRRKSKGRRANLPFELEDSELEQQMELAWDNDRLKKKQRKEEREEQRALGLLGSGKKAMKNAASGITMMDEIKEQIIHFLRSTEESLQLPPMESQQRLYMHQIATFFEVDSRSHGPAKSRATVLTRRIDTPAYEQYTVTELMDRMQYKNIKKQPVRPNRKGGRQTMTAVKVRRSRGGGGAVAGVSYMDGEVVGAAAPELAADNKGRGMLEKMGWSHGMALGAVTNKGILQPITHVVKNTKAGLG